MITTRPKTARGVKTRKPATKTQIREAVRQVQETAARLKEAHVSVAGSLPLQESAQTGAMVALVLPLEVATALAVPGGEPPQDLHITLAFIPNGAELAPDIQHLLQDVVADFAEQWSVVEGRIAGLGRFNATEWSDGKDVVYASLDAPCLPELRQELVAALESAGVEVAHNHGFSPHVTLAYVEPGAQLPVNAVPTTAVCFTALSLVVGEVLHQFPFGDGEDEAETLEGAVEEVAPAGDQMATSALQALAQAFAIGATLAESKPTTPVQASIPSTVRTSASIDERPFVVDGVRLSAGQIQRMANLLAGTSRHSLGHPVDLAEAIDVWRRQNHVVTRASGRQRWQVHSNSPTWRESDVKTTGRVFEAHGNQYTGKQGEEEEGGHAFGAVAGHPFGALNAAQMAKALATRAAKAGAGKAAAAQPKTEATGTKTSEQPQESAFHEQLVQATLNKLDLETKWNRAMGEETKAEEAVQAGSPAEKARYKELQEKMLVAREQSKKAEDEWDNAAKHLEELSKQATPRDLLKANRMADEYQRGISSPQYRQLNLFGESRRQPEASSDPGPSPLQRLQEAVDSAVAKRKALRVLESLTHTVRTAKAIREAKRRHRRTVRK